MQKANTHDAAESLVMMKRRQSTIMVAVLLCAAVAVAQRSRGAAGSIHGTGNPGATAGPAPVVKWTRPNIVSGTDTRDVQFSSRTEMVLVPVVVTKDGKHVSGLTKDDFAVEEEGKPQTIAGFDEITTRGTGLKKVEAAPGVYSNTLNAGQAQSVTIIAMDTVNTPFLDQTRARAALVRYLAENVNHNNPTMLLTIHRGGVRTIHSFTTDPAVLVAALKRVSGELPMMEGLQDFAPPVADASASSAAVLNSSLNTTVADAVAVGNEAAAISGFVRGVGAEFDSYQRSAAVEVTLEAFQYIAQAFKGIPGRKSLIWATGSFPIEIDQRSLALVGSGAPNNLYERTMQLLGDANIAVYPVDVRGLMVSVSPDRMGTLQTLEMFASMTGGRAFYNRNDFSTAFREAADDNSGYYLLSYYLDKSNPKAGWRKLEVKVRRDGTKVRARQGFFLTRSTVDPSLTRDMDLFVALQSPLDYTALPVTVRFTGQDDGGKNCPEPPEDPSGRPAKVSGPCRKVGFEIVLPANAASIDETDNNRVSIDFRVLARNAQGMPTGGFGQDFTARLKPNGVQQIKENGITYTNVLQVRPGEQMVRFVVRDNTTGRTGSVLVPLTVN